MIIPNDYSFARYLAAKRSVDDRALNKHVWQTLHEHLKPSVQQPLEVLEVGAGAGAMFQRAMEWGLLSQAHYTALDADRENVQYARAHMPIWASKMGYSIRPAGTDCFTLETINGQVQLSLETMDVFDFIQRERGQRHWDLLIAHAFLDLMDIPATLPQLFSLCQPGGLFYFTINFDGLTLLEPTIDPALDEQIQSLYHRTMDERITAGRPSGDSRSGRRLFSHLKAAGAVLLDAGASDWVVHPGPAGYPAEEAYFLHYIIHTIALALHRHPQLDEKQFESWIRERHAQIERNELVYIAHQLDFVGRVAHT